MRSLLPLLVPAVLAACGAEPVPDGPQVVDLELAIARGRCTACHAVDGPAAARLEALPTPPLGGLEGTVAGPWLEAFLAGHFAAGAGPDPDAAAGAAADLAAFVLGRSGADAPEPWPAAAVGAAEIERGARLFDEAGCAACHADAADGTRGVEGLAAKTHLDRVVQVLRDPRTARPDLRAHDFGLDAGDARALAAWLLRAQRVAEEDAPPAPGLAFECFELQIDTAGLPDLDGLEPAARGHAEAIDVAPRTRDDHFALRFRGRVQVPEAGAWTFVTGSDDSSWLWIDGELVVRNEGLAPHRRRDGTVELAAGWHDLVVVYTEARGGESLEVLWQGPGVDRAPIPRAALSAKTAALVPPARAGSAGDPERGRALFAARHCGACHDAPADTGSPGPLGPPWDAVRSADRPCPVVPTPAVAGVRALPVAAAARAPADELRYRLARDGCVRCHVRDGAGGLDPAARDRLVEVEDLGDEGRLPPDLTAVGHRLRRGWIEAVLTGARAARPYVRARMPRLSAADAAAYAALFDAVDARPGDDVEPPFSAEAAAAGQRIAGVEGFACVACHRVAGHASSGPQGMDLAFQHERLKPEWFRTWLLAPAVHRPGTRMPSFWPVADAAALRQVDAVRAWLSLGHAMPLPAGVGAAGSAYVLDADGTRPRLHGAFLDGLSARCIAVGTPERTHYAYDLAHQRLAWLWRGAFLDARGTWDGRAGQLLTPLGEDRITLPDGCPFALVDGAAEPRMLGFRLDADGYPVWRIGVGPVEVEDHPRPRWTAGGSELVRTVRARGGAVRMALPPPGGRVRVEVDGAPRADVVVEDGAAVEVVYRW